MTRFFFLDYATSVCLDGIRERKGKPRSDIPWTETQDDQEFIEFIKNYELQNRPAVLKLLDKYRSKDIHVFSSREQAEEFLHRIQGKF